jgi:Pyruvate/2-oxoacid:ferredoxin oxidoreductase delta subunit
LRWGAGATATSTATATPISFLDRFYARRTPSEAPRVALREGLAHVETTRVGTPELATAPVSRDLPPTEARALGGVVRLLQQHCLAWTRSFCTVCSERCPAPGAIVLDLGRPRVVASACNGCGVCVQVCPAPVNAFAAEPRDEAGA